MMLNYSQWQQYNYFSIYVKILKGQFLIPSMPPYSGKKGIELGMFGIAFFVDVEEPETVCPYVV
jgi:hypothetical protein